MQAKGKKNVTFYLKPVKKLKFEKLLNQQMVKVVLHGRQVDRLPRERLQTRTSQTKHFELFI